MKRIFLKTLICACAMAVLSIGSVRADTVIYANSGNYNGTNFAMSNGQEVGNEITVAPGYSLTSFAIEYAAPMVLAADVGVDVRFYYNNGPLANGYPTPGPLFFDSGWFYNGAGNIQSGTQEPSGNYAYNINYTTSDFSSGAQDGWAPNFTVPTDFTFTIAWTNLDGSDVIDMPLANNTPGISTGDYWLNNNGSWEMLSNSVPANFLVEFQGVPEPSVFGLAAIGGALLLGINKLRRKS